MAKRIAALFMILFLVIAMGFSGCGTKTGTDGEKLRQNQRVKQRGDKAPRQRRSWNLSTYMVPGRWAASPGIV